MAPWEVVDRRGEHEATLRCYTHTGLVVTRRMSLCPDRPRLQIHEEVRNRSEVPFAYAWGHHPAFAAVPGTRLEIDGARFAVDAGFTTSEADLRPGCEGAWPWAEARDGSPVDLRSMPDPPAERVIYVTELTEPRVRILRPDTRDFLTLEWSADAFPYAWVWVNHGATRFPWFGRLSSIAVEPVNVWPADGLAAAVERGQAPVLPGGESRQGWLVVSLADE